MTKYGPTSLASSAWLCIAVICPARVFPPQREWIALKIPKIQRDSRFDIPICGSYATVGGLDFDLKESLAVFLAGNMRRRFSRVGANRTGCMGSNDSAG